MTPTFASDSTGMGRAFAGFAFWSTVTEWPLGGRIAPMAASFKIELAGRTHGPISFG